LFDLWILKMFPEILVLIVFVIFFIIFEFYIYFF